MKKVNENLNEKNGWFQFFCYIEIMSEATYYQKNRNVILNGAKDYYKNDQEGLRDNARDNTEIYLKNNKK